MNYPLISDYIEAIKSAEDNFEELKHLRPVLDEDGEPVMTGGNFAVVFKMKNEQTGKLHAVKCFLKEQEGRAEAYRMIAEELEYVNSTFLTPIKYLDKELFVDSKNSDESEFPVLLMDWVEGMTLDKYLREHIDDQYELSLLAYQFSRLAMWLMPQPFAHGDLKPDNILVKDDGTLVLVDYDGMYVPAMKGQKARELGSPDFRHPGRTEDFFDEHIDDFSLASILLSLKAISLQPSLLEEYGASDRLLFSEKDYRNLSESSALGALQPLMQDAELASLYSLYILALSQNNLSQVSFRLFNLKRPDKSQYEEENLSTEVTEEDLANAWTDEYGVKYSADRKRLLKAPKDIVSYNIKFGTKVICNKSFRATNIQHISIPSSVKEIGFEAFSYCKKLQFVNVPDSIKILRERVFYCCTNLSEISLSNHLICIEKEAFRLCYSLACVSIPKTVTTIGDSAFYGCSSLTSITIPNKVTSIGEWAFCECVKLRKIDLPQYLKTLETGIFACCDSLIDIKLPNSITTIGDSSFKKCRNLKSVNIPNNVITIGESAFLGCSNLVSVDIPNSVLKLGNRAFKYCKTLTDIIIPKSITSIGYKLFGGCSRLTNVTLHDKITCIGISAFKDCCSLKRIHIPNGVIKIEDSAFLGCKNLESIDIPNSVTAIGPEAFAWCDSLDNIILPHNLLEIKYGTFEGCSSLTHITIPVRVRELGHSAFSGCSALSNLVIPSSLKKIGNWAFTECVNLTELLIPFSVTNLGENAFLGCYNIKNIIVDEDNETYDSRNDCNAIIETSTNTLVFGCENTIIPNTISNIGSNAFRECHGLICINIPDSVENIGERSFMECDHLTNINLSNNLKSIGKEAFWLCRSLLEIIIPNQVTHIEKEAFYGCDNITSIYIPDSVISIGHSAFAGCSELVKIEVDSNNIIYDSRDSCNAIIKTDTNILMLGCMNTIIPNGIEVIGNNAFYRCVNLKKMSIPESVRIIEYEAFLSCKGLVSIKIPKSVTTIGYHAFGGCCGLQNISVENENETYDSRNDCNSIIESSTNILILGCPNTIIPNTIKTIGKGAFSGCKDLASIIIPDGVVRIEDGAFYGCALEMINIPNGVVSVGSSFRQCKKLKCIYLPSSISKISYFAFEDCEELSTIYIPNGTWNKFEAMLNDYKSLLREEVVIEGIKGYRRAFCTNEIKKIEKVEIIKGSLSTMVCFYMTDGTQKYIPLNKESQLSIGDEVDLNKAKLIEFPGKGIFYGFGVDGKYLTKNIVDA